ncbi:aldehyde dehydrogenase family protein [Kineococcus rhizosphaerae]|uniref:aldehyde dehydrogenase family protein n=1 Tax=Kineococcus rhizosphaerae TaxID=559628 RepID=UPI003CCB93B2
MGPPLGRLRRGRPARSTFPRRRREGATVVMRGLRPQGPGWHHPLALLTGTTPRVRVSDEEVFGPVAVLSTVSSRQEAIDITSHPQRVGVEHLGGGRRGAAAANSPTWACTPSRTASGRPAANKASATPPASPGRVRAWDRAR